MATQNTIPKLLNALRLSLREVADWVVNLGVLRDAEEMLKVDQQNGRFDEQGASVGAK